MWNADPLTVYQVERDAQEKKVLDHVRRCEARRAKQASRAMQRSRGMVSTILGGLGNLLVGAGERLQRRAGDNIVRGELSWQ